MEYRAGFLPERTTPPLWSARSPSTSTASPLSDATARPRRLLHLRAAPPAARPRRRLAAWPRAPRLGRRRRLSRCRAACDGGGRRARDDARRRHLLRADSRVDRVRADGARATARRAALRVDRRADLRPLRRAARHGQRRHRRLRRGDRHLPAGAVGARREQRGDRAALPVGDVRRRAHARRLAPPPRPLRDDAAGA